MHLDTETIPPPSPRSGTSDQLYARDAFLHTAKGVPTAPLLRAAASAIHSLWRQGYRLEDYPPLDWRFENTPQGWCLAAPRRGLTVGDAPLTLDALTRCLVSWRLELEGLVDERIMLRFLLLFLEQEPVDAARVVWYLDEIEALADHRRTDHLTRCVNRYRSRLPPAQTDLALARYLADRRMPVALPLLHGTTRSAGAWLRDAILAGANWYGAAAAWSRDLQRLERLGCTLRERPILEQLQIQFTEHGATPVPAWIPPECVGPKRPRWRTQASLPDELEAEIHALRSRLVRT